VFVVTEAMRQRIRQEVRSIMKGQRLGVRSLRIPAYLGGDFVKPGKKPRSIETLLNPIDPGPASEEED
jgi:hypothetical protein